MVGADEAGRSRRDTQNRPSTIAVIVFQRSGRGTTLRFKTRQLALCCSVLIAIDGMAALRAACAQAVADPAGTAVKPGTAHHQAGRSATPARAPQRLPRDETEELNVTAGTRTANGVTNTTPGGGLMPPQTAPRAQSGVTRDFIAKQSPTSNVQSLIADLPGVVTANNDPLNLTGDYLAIRGMTQQEIGYTFEGAPVADPVNYQPYTNILADTENLGGVTVSQGSPDIAAPLYNAVGGQIAVEEIDPAHTAGGYVDLMGGTKSANKEFIRLESGDIGRSGVRGFVSFSYISGNNWRGPGDLNREHIDLKLAKDWGENNSARVIFAYNHTQYTSFLNPSLAQWNQYGRSYNLDGKYTPGDANYYKLNDTINNALMLIAPVKLTLAPGLRLNETPYLLDFYGPAPYGENIPETGGYEGTVPTGPLNQPYATGGVLTTQAVDPYIQKTAGLNNELEWKRGHNTLSAGYWYAYTNHDERATFATVDYDGNVSNARGRFAIVTGTGQLLTPYNINFKQQSNVLFVADTINLLNDRLALTAGFKAAMVQRLASNLVPGAQYYNDRNYFEPLPQLSASYKLTEHDQIYADATTAFHAPGSVEAYVQLFDPGSSHAVEQPGDLKPEYSIGEEIGYRHSGFISFSAAFFNYNLTHHQVTSEAYLAGTTDLVSEPLDTGGETARGVQAEIGLGHWHHFSPYLSGQYLHATIDNNFNAGADYLPTTGKTEVESPHFTGAIGMQYDDGRFFGNFDLRYVDSQYSTFMNDQSIPAYVVSDVTLGYRLPSIGPARHPQIQLNLVNIGDNNYLSGVAGVSGNAATTKGVYGTTLAGGSPSYFVGGGFAALVSVSSGF
jgi:iron complex outermembrane receptor protein